MSANDWRASGGSREDNPSGPQVVNFPQKPCRLNICSKLLADLETSGLGEVYHLLGLIDVLLESRQR